MSLSIVQQSEQGDLFTTSEAIAEGAGVEHRATLQLISNNVADLEEFGLVAFEMRARSAGQHGGGDRRIARLNEQQATLILTYLRNTEQVRAFKKNLVKAFYEMAHKMNRPLTLEEKSLQVIGELTERVEAHRRELAIAKPKAAAWDSLVGSTGTWSVGEAAAALQEHKITDIGRNRLFKLLQGMGYLYREGGSWLAKQQYRQQGLFEHKLRTYRDYETGEEVAAHPQIRITGKGLEAIRRKMTSYNATKELAA